MVDAFKFRGRMWSFRILDTIQRSECILRQLREPLTVTRVVANKSVVTTADNAASSLRSGRLSAAVPHFRRSTINYYESKNENLSTSNIGSHRANG